MVAPSAPIILDSPILVLICSSYCKLSTIKLPIKYIESLENVDLTSYLVKNVKTLLKEVNVLLKLIEDGDFEQVSKFINQTTYLFRGAAGVRHVDFIAHKKS